MRMEKKTKLLFIDAPLFSACVCCGVPHHSRFVFKEPPFSFNSSAIDR